jgi:hypothetical protein
LRFTLSQPVTAAIPPGDKSLFRLAMNLAAQITPISEPEQNELHWLAESLDPIFPRDNA